MLVYNANESTRVGALGDGWVVTPGLMLNHHYSEADHTNPLIQHVFIEHLLGNGHCAVK